VSAFGCGFVDKLTGYASRLVAETEQSLLESDSVLNLLLDYARLCSVSATNLLA